MEIIFKNSKKEKPALQSIYDIRGCNTIHKKQSRN